MKFTNYCMLVLGKTDGCILEISKISEGGPNVLPAKGICITTFISAFTPPELEDYFKDLGRNFFLFEMDPSTSGFNINNKEVANKLFGSVDNKLELEEMSNRMIDDLKSTSDMKTVSGNSKGINVESKVRKRKVDKEYYQELNPKEKQKMIDEIIDKGATNLTSHDKEILEILTKK